mmetsp:Transcript_4097/g.10644  ORF Transcript_4097/g.10644 Transcript_4097/m.10644 type:complete len:119 (+) Transcript_4097:165-521(+)
MLRIQTKNKRRRVYHFSALSNAVTIVELISSKWTKYVNKIRLPMKIDSEMSREKIVVKIPIIKTTPLLFCQNLKYFDDQRIHFLFCEVPSFFIVSGKGSMSISKNDYRTGGLKIRAPF